MAKNNKKSEQKVVVENEQKKEVNTSNLTKAELKKEIETQLETAKANNDSTSQVLEYTLKNWAKTKKEDIVAILDEVRKASAKKTEETHKEEPKTENSIKKVKKSDKNKKTEDTESADEKTNAETKEKKDKTSKKLSHEFEFPASLEVGEEEYEIAYDIKSMDDLRKCVDEDEEEIIFAFHWTRKGLKAGYFNDFKYPKDGFPNELDITTPYYISDEGITAYCISMYTEANYVILPEDFEIFEDGTRISGFLEMQIYRKK